LTAKIGSQVIWQGPVEEKLTRVAVADLKISPGVTPIVFTTDAPGVPESPNSDARSLTFALYDVTLD
jgi:hypothetical protein